MAIDLLFFSSTSRIPSPNPNPSPESPSDFEPVCGANSKMGLAKRNIGSSSLEMDSRRVSSWSSRSRYYYFGIDGQHVASLVPVNGGVSSYFSCVCSSFSVLLCAGK
ncbi:uncharacterized protein LOC109849878 [Asparagus officinalis]|uniref:uncharacterized protein LOC109849878 n=1 Tax=Asparagus officinalis TaxID=4686 RepID=UPI00098E2E3F|nr:uncharacterized protein LOC109849878 [Asparagus officinalis]